MKWVKDFQSEEKKKQSLIILFALNGRMAKTTKYTRTHRNARIESIAAQEPLFTPLTRFSLIWLI